MGYLITLFLLILGINCFADTFEKVSDTEIRRTSEVIENVPALANQCESIRDNLNRTRESFQRSIDEYTAQVNKCESDLQEIKNSTGVDVTEESINP